MLQPALLGGVTIGVLSALPIVNLANACCCAWIVFGGGLAAWLLQQQRPDPIAAGDGAVAGLAAGVVGAVVWLALEIPLRLALAPLHAGLVDAALRNAGDLPPAVQYWLESMKSGALVGAGLAFGFLVMLVVGSVFAMIGGVIGALLFRKPAAPPAAPEPPSWAPPPLPPTS